VQVAGTAAAGANRKASRQVRLCSRGKSCNLFVAHMNPLDLMMVITVTIASTFSIGKKRFVNVGRHFGLASGVVSLIFGLVIAYQIGFVNGLFTGHAHWIPR